GTADGGAGRGNPPAADRLGQPAVRARAADVGQQSHQHTRQGPPVMEARFVFAQRDFLKYSEYLRQGGITLKRRIILFMLVACALISAGCVGGTGKSGVSLEAELSAVVGQM